MSFDNKYYPNRKDWRKSYYRSQRHDKSCRPHGGCPYCLGNRLHSYRKRKFKALEEIKAFPNNWGKSLDSEDELLINKSSEREANEKK